MADKWRFVGWVCYDGKGADDVPISIQALRDLLHDQHVHPTHMVRKCFRRGKEVQLSSPIPTIQAVKDDNQSPSDAE
jgi:hypothetical protein